MNSKIGDEIVIKDHKHNEIMVGARYIDKNYRIRLTTGEHSGEVLHRHEYEVVEKLANQENPLAVIGMIWMAL